MRKTKQRKRRFSEQRRHRMAEALKHRKNGMGYEQIGQKLGVSAQQAHRDVQDALLDITKEPAQQVRELELQRSEEQHLRLNGEIGRVLRHLNAVTEKSGATDLKAVDQIRRLIESQDKVARTRHRLNGFDMGVQVDASVDVTESINRAFQTIMASDPEVFESDLDA